MTMTVANHHDAIKAAIHHPDFTEKQRVVVLALSIPIVLLESDDEERKPTWVEVKVVWEYSQWEANMVGITIPDFDLELVKDINKNPDNYKNYK
jgi:hypothetical protein